MWIVTYSDYDCYEILGYTNSKSQAEKCRDYKMLLLSNEKPYGQHVDIKSIANLDESNFDELTREYYEREAQKRKAEEDAIREKELAELNRLREKYGI